MATPETYRELARRHAAGIRPVGGPGPGEAAGIAPECGATVTELAILAAVRFPGSWQRGMAAL
jgi:hypothetical protein